MGSIPAILDILLSLKKSSIKRKAPITGLRGIKRRKPAFYKSLNSTRGRFFSKLSKFTSSILGTPSKLSTSKLPLKCTSRSTSKLFFRFTVRSNVTSYPISKNATKLDSFWFSQIPPLLTHVSKGDFLRELSPRSSYVPQMIFTSTNLFNLPKGPLTATHFLETPLFCRLNFPLEALNSRSPISHNLLLGLRLTLIPNVAPLAQEWTEFFRIRQMVQFKRDLTTANVRIKKASRQYFSFHSYLNSSKLSFSGRIKLVVPAAILNLRGSFWSSSDTPQGANCLNSPVLQAKTVHQLTKRYLIPRSSNAAPMTLKPSSPYRPHLKLTRKSPSRKLIGLPLLKRRGPKPKPAHRFKSRTRKLSRYLKFRLGRTRWFSVRKFKRVRRTTKRLTRRSRGLSRRLNRYKAFAGLLRRRNRQLRRFKMDSLNLSHKRLIVAQPRGFYTPHKSFRAKIRRINSRNFSHVRRKFLNSFTHAGAIANSVSSNLLLPAKQPTPTNPNSQQLTRCLVKNWALSTPTLSEFWTNPTLLKYLLTLESQIRLKSDPLKSSILQAQHQLQAYVFPSNGDRLVRSNLWLVPSSNYVLRRKLLRSTFSHLFLFNLSMWYYKSLISFIENCSGRKVSLHFGPFLEGALTFEDKARCALWGNRVMGFQRILGHKIFVQEALMLVALSLRLKDTTFLANWIRGMLKRMSFWKYRLLFRYLKFLFQHIFRPNFALFDFRGLKLRLKGKISVAGNARTRTLFYRVGDTSHSKMNNKVSYDLSYVNTFTGVMGFKLWFFY